MSGANESGDHEFRKAKLFRQLFLVSVIPDSLLILPAFVFC